VGNQGWVVTGAGVGYRHLANAILPMRLIDKTVARTGNTV
jgi:hypothetical protein